MFWLSIESELIEACQHRKDVILGQVYRTGVHRFHEALKGHLSCGNWTLILAARTLEIPTIPVNAVSNFPLANTGANPVMMPTWFIGAWWWNMAGSEIRHWSILDLKKEEEVTADYLFRKMIKLLKPVVSDRGQEFLLVESLLANPNDLTIPKKVARVYLKLAVQEGMPGAGK